MSLGLLVPLCGPHSFLKQLPPESLLGHLIHECRIVEFTPWDFDSACKMGTEGLGFDWCLVWIWWFCNLTFRNIPSPWLWVHILVFKESLMVPHYYENPETFNDKSGPTENMSTLVFVFLASVSLTWPPSHTTPSSFQPFFLFCLFVSAVFSFTGLWISLSLSPYSNSSLCCSLYPH